MFHKICLHQAIKSIYLFSYNGCTLSYGKSWILCHISIQNRYHTICLLNRCNLIGMKEEKNLFPIGNYFYFTERQFN